jgi:hypothetical protein
VLNSGYKFDKTPNNFIIYSGESGNFNRWAINLKI